VRRADGLLRKLTEKKEGGEMGRAGRMGREEFFFLFFFQIPFLNQFQTFLNSNLLHVFKFNF
jgi:hypothetical protein